MYLGRRWSGRRAQGSQKQRPKGRHVYENILCFASRRRRAFGLQLLAPAVVLVLPTTITRQCSDNAAGSERCYNRCSQIHPGSLRGFPRSAVEMKLRDEIKAKDGKAKAVGLCSLLGVMTLGRQAVLYLCIPLQDPLSCHGLVDLCHT